jgi:hypothetical protein
LYGGVLIHKTTIKDERKRKGTQDMNNKEHVHNVKCVMSFAVGYKKSLVS